MLEITHWYGRLGNNIFQVKNCLHLAYYLNCNIKLPKHEYFTKCYIEINPKQKKNSEIIEMGSFFFYHKIKLAKFNMKIFSMNKKKVIHQLTELFKFKYQNDAIIPDNPLDLHIHIRSGDLFNQNSKYQLNKNYISPPLDYYVQIINRYQNLNSFRIHLISEDRKNPCINELIKRFPHLVFEISTLDMDIKKIMGCHQIIYGYGTFIPALLIFNQNIRQVFYPNYQRIRSAIGIAFYSKLENVREYEIDIKDYIKHMGKEWKNSEKQYQIMLNYRFPKSIIKF